MAYPKEILGTTGDEPQGKGDQPVTISAPPAGGVTIDPQNPLPESSWFWRRVITIAITIASGAALWHVLEALHDLGSADGLLELGKWILCFCGLVLTYYFVGPSAAELTNMIQTASIMKRSIGLATTTAQNNPDRPDFPAAGADSGPLGYPPTQIALSTPDEAPSRPDGDLTSGVQEDAAPRGRS